MGHFFVLLPILLLMAALLERAYRADRTNTYAKYFRNFAWLWTACTLIGSSSIFLAESGILDLKPQYAQLVGASLSLPFHYFASAALLLLPFAIYRRYMKVGYALATLVIAGGAFIGSVIFVKANNLFASLGAFQGIYQFAWANLPNIRLSVILIVLIPVALFFVREALVASTAEARTRILVIAIGTAWIGVLGGVHVWLGPPPVGFEVDNADLLLPLGFLIVFLGLFYHRRTAIQAQPSTPELS